MNITTSIQVGTKVLYVVRDGAEFQEGVVTKVTKATFKFTTTHDGKERGPFSNVPNWVKVYELYKAPKWGRDQKVFEDTPANRQEIIDRNARLQAEREQKALQAKIRQEKRESEEAQQLEEVMDACGCHSGLPLKQMRSMETMPDNNRVYTLVIPVKPEYAERKVGWELIIVRCKDVEEMDWDSPRDENGDRKMIHRVEAAYTYTNGNSYSFSSISTSKYKNDQAAVWDCIRNQYHSW